MTASYYQQSMLLATGDDTDDIDNHLAECLCDRCIDNLIIAMREDRQ